jgi:predicted esterase
MNAMATDIQRILIPSLTHGVTLVREARAAASRGLLVGFHGYLETAAIQMERLAAIPGSAQWTLVSIEGLHRVYRGRSHDVVASWMSREDREVAIADNLAYVAAALDEVPHDRSTRVVYAGFSQGVAMAFRAALLGRDRAHGIIAVGGDVPPELLGDSRLRYPPVCLARGARDEWFTQAKFDADLAALTARGAPLRPLLHEGAHEWNADVATAAGEFLEQLARDEGAEAMGPARDEGAEPQK